MELPSPVSRLLISLSLLCFLCSAQQQTLCGNSLFCLGGECSADVCTCPQDYPICNLSSNTTCTEIPDFCLNGGVCNDTTGEISCNCNPGTVGARCYPDLCNSSDPCQNNSNCTQAGNSTVCQCDLCHEGEFCQTRIDKCSANPCKNGATCTTYCDPGPPYCDCLSGWTGPTCINDRDECSDDTSLEYRHKCVNGACVNNDGGYTCDCNTGYTGDLCHLDINECAEDSGYQCYTNHTFNCTDLPGSYECACNPGYTGNNCETVNCSDELCNSRGACTEENNDWICICDQFYEDPTCSIPGPCLISPCVNGECSQYEENQGSGFVYSCDCQTGWTNSSNCAEDINECLVDDPCENNSTCTNTEGGYNCTCDALWTGDNCTMDVDECQANVSICGEGQCTNLEPGYICNCSGTGYIGLNCEIRDYCEELCVTEHSISCVNRESSANCTCSEDWVSPDCSIMDDCKSSPCQNGGTCETLLVNNYNPTCRCDEVRFTGDTCTQLLTGPGTYKPPPINLVSIVVPIAVAVVVIVFIAVVVCLCLARKKRATRGIYSPSREETVGNRLELGFSLKPPPEERLI